MVRSVVAGLVVVALLGVGCGDDDPKAAPEGTSSEGTIPKGEVAPTRLKYLKGSTTLKESGVAQVTINMMGTSWVDTPTGTLHFGYSQRLSNNCIVKDLTLDGPVFTGTAKTSPTLKLVYSTRNTAYTPSCGVLKPPTYTSSAGECSVTLEPATAAEVKGTYTCVNVPSTSPYKGNFQGTFTATP